MAVFPHKTIVLPRFWPSLLVIAPNYNDTESTRMLAFYREVVPKSPLYFIHQISAVPLFISLFAVIRSVIFGTIENGPFTMGTQNLVNVYSLGGILAYIFLFSH